MSTEMVRQTMFNLGQVDQVVWKRTEIDEYLSAAQSLLNMEVGTTGLARKRKGTSLLFNVTPYAQINSRMYEFVDKFGNYYVLLSANGFFHVFATPSTEAFVVTNTGANVVTNTGAFVVANTDSLQFIQSIPTPYQTGDLDNIDYTEDADSLVLTHPLYAPARIYISMYNPNTFPTFAWQYLNIYPLPSYDFNTINYNNYTVVASVISGILTFMITNPSGATGFNTDWIGGQIIGGGASDLEPVGYAIITNVTNLGNTTTFTATVQIPFATPFSTQGSQYSIRQPAWSAKLGFPAKVLFFQNRLWLANTQSLPITIFGSKINTPISFDVGVGKDTDAIVYTIGQTGTGDIQWMNGGKQLEIFCLNNEFACPQDQNSGLTPSTFSVRQQSSYGASRLLKPITYINDTYYAIRTGQALINYHYNGIGLTYTSTNISAASKNLVRNPSNRALLRGSDDSQDNFIYFINPNDETITTFQFAHEHKLAALTPATFQNDVQLIDIVTIDNTIYILKFYVLTDQFTIEQFDETVKVDCAFSANMASDGTVTGLDLLDNYRVQVIFENQDFGQYVVVGGQIHVQNPSMFSGEVTIGLLYDIELIPMYPYGGKTSSPFKKQVTRIYIDYYQSLNFNINGDLVPYQNFVDIQAGLPLTPQTDTAIVSPFYGWNRFDNNGVPIISITQSSPFDLQILSIGYQIGVAVL